MGLWFKKKSYDTFQYNIDELRKQLDKLAPKLYYNQGEAGFKAMRRVLEISRNISALSVGRLKGKDVDEFHRHVGRLTAFDDVLGLVEQLITVERNRARSGKQREAKRTMGQDRHDATQAVDF